MPAKYKGRYLFTERQLQEYDRTLAYLRRLHRDALRELRQVNRSNLTHKRYAQSSVFLTSVGTQIISAVKSLVEILRSAGELLLPRVIFEVSPLCSNCTAPPDLHDHPGDEVPALDPAHLHELDQLLDFANQIRGQLWTRSMRSKDLIPGTLFKGLERLTNALVKERRHFQETAAAPPTPIEFRVNDPVCCVCHQPLEIIDDPVKS